MLGLGFRHQTDPQAKYSVYRDSKFFSTKVNIQVNIF